MTDSDDAVNVDSSKKDSAAKRKPHVTERPRSDKSGGRHRSDRHRSSHSRRHADSRYRESRRSHRERSRRSNRHHRSPSDSESSYGSRGGSRSPSVSRRRGSRSRSHSASSIDSDSLISTSKRRQMQLKSGTSGAITTLSKSESKLSSKNDPSFAKRRRLTAGEMSEKYGVREEDIENRIAAEVKKWVDEEANRRFHQSLYDPKDETQQKVQRDVRQKLEDHMKEQKAQLVSLMHAEIEKEKRQIIEAFKRDEQEKRHNAQQLEDIERQNNERLEQARREQEEKQAQAAQSRLNSLLVKDLVSKQKRQTQEQEQTQSHVQHESSSTTFSLNDSLDPPAKKLFSFKLVNDEEDY